MDNKYDETVSTSKEESLLKALQIFEEDNNKIKEKNAVKRPDINVAVSFVKVFLVFLLYAGCLIAACFSFKYNVVVAVICLIIFAVSVIFSVKKTVILLVLLYQKLAPEKLRQACLFTPSCSEYMILSINKYGVCKGVYRGVKRLLKCHYPNGGEDYP